MSDSDSAGRDRRLGLVVLALALLPALAAIWCVRGFLTQDGPAHLYSAQVLLDSLRPDSPYQAVYEVRWQPLPNWAGHLALMGLLAVLPAWVAEKVLISATFVLPAIGTFWLRGRVAGWKGAPTAALLCALLSLNYLWLLGFYSFLLGAALFPITLGVWWSGRDRPTAPRAAALMALIAAGYFCHLVSLGLTAVSLVVLALVTPGPDRVRRLRFTLIVLAPLLPLGLVYKGIMSQGGAIEPIWEHLSHPYSLKSWVSQVGWVDPLTLCAKKSIPLLDRSHPAFAALTPVFWLLIALNALFVARCLDPHRGQGDNPGRGTRTGWTVLALLFLVGGLVCPDSLGLSHGFYLAQRVVLLGLIALVPALNLGTTGWPRRLATAALGLAVAVQSAYVWDYAIRSDRLAREFQRAYSLVGHGRRLAVLYLDLKQPFRANPMLHADGLLGLGNDNIVWNDYETAFYYFPVQVRPDVPHPSPLELEQVSIRDDSSEAAGRADAWRDFLERERSRIDALVVWGRDPGGLDPISERWFPRVEQQGRVRVLYPR
jgi:hypothetical protein